ncbi:response regulator [Fimbriiglobus ruber]|uniref:Response regulator n=1 Tax=Fimbriiglobus ruber TaxID=1908690 RepID=A0A225D953_9BACT|nr:response regulator [Fimbriiglobus ruber]
MGGDGTWVVRDLESTNGTYLNGNKLPPGEHAVRPRDVIQFGKVAVLVELVDATLDGPPSDQMIVTAAARSTFEEGLKRIAFDRNSMPRAGDQLLALLRAGHHLNHLESEDQLLESILNDAVSVLDAQRGAIVLADGDGPDVKLRLRALAVGSSESKGRFHFSKRLTARCYAKGESVLFCNVQDDGDLMTQSIADGAMSSVLCVLLRTPRRKLGVLHLDRGFFQSPFTEDDLLLADALAANVSAGIECAALLKKQRALFLKTITMLAQMVELRDEYTGGHTQRVTRYATMLGEKLDLPEDQLELLRLGTPLHDIGKIGISDEILRAPRRLTPQEFATMQTHTTLGAEYLGGIPELHPIIPIVRNHHERWDGTGYPDRMSKEEIPFLARIVAVADAFDAMTSHRPYHESKRGRSPVDAFAEVERQAGRQFDPKCAEAFLLIREEIMRTMYELMPETTGFHPAPSGPVTAIGLRQQDEAEATESASAEHYL